MDVWEGEARECGGAEEKESGIPPFRGAGGLWDRYDPRTLEISYFLANPGKAWPVIREIFYDHFGKARPNRAHQVLARLENDGWPRGPGSNERSQLKTLITQNIDSLLSIVDDAFRASCHYISTVSKANFKCSFSGRE